MLSGRLRGKAIRRTDSTAAIQRVMRERALSVSERAIPVRRSALAGLQQLNELGPQPAVEPLSGLLRQAEKLHTELIALDPLDRSEFDGQRVRLIRQEDTHPDVTAALHLPVAQNRTTAERQIGQNTFPDKRRPAENYRVTEPVPGINPAIGK